jgi:Bifunctional DNA primase/polymerase, N-terminal
MAEAISVPPLSDYNGWARFWYDVVGGNVIPAKTREKKTFIKWTSYQDGPIPRETFEEWIRNDEFRDGMALILGRVWRGNYAGKYLVFIDLDNQKAIDEFAPNLRETATHFIVEQHKDNTSKAHILVYSDIPFPKKSSDKNKLEAEDDLFKLDNDLIPAIEIKGEGSHGIVYCTPSFHQNGERYQIIGVNIPEVLTAEQAHQMIQHMDGVCQKYGLKYLQQQQNGGSSNNLIPISELYSDNFVIYEGHNRHEALLRIMESSVIRFRTTMSPDTIKTFCRFWNQMHCKPALDDKEFERQWKDALKFVSRLDAEKAAAESNEEFLDGCVMAELISRSPETYAAVIRKDDYHNPSTGFKQAIRAVQEVVIERKKDKETGEITKEIKYKHFILNAIPVTPIEVIEDPLFKQTKYRMRWEYVGPSNEIKQTPEPVGPFTKDELKRYLLEQTNWVYKQRLLDDTLTQILKGYSTRKGMSKTVIEIGPEGFFLLDDKIVASKLNIKEHGSEEGNVYAQAVQVILDLQKNFFKSPRDRTRLAHYIKLFMIAPFDYVRKQKGIAQTGKWIPRGDLAGESGTGKSEFGRLACYIWRLNPDTHILPKRSIDSEARIINTLASTTMTLAFEEPDFLTHHKNKPATESILSVLKNTVDQLEGYRLTQTHQKIIEPYLAHFIITHNSNPIAEQGAIRRFVIDMFRPSDKKDTKKNRHQVEEYRKFITENKEKLAYIGDFVKFYIVDKGHTEILSQDWVTAGKTLLRVLFTWSDLDQVEEDVRWSDPNMENYKTPNWLIDGVIESNAEGGSGFSDADLEAERRELIRSALLGYVNDVWAKQRYEYEKIAIENNSSKPTLPLNTLSPNMRIDWLVENNKLRGFTKHPKYGICMTTAVIDAIKPYGLNVDNRIKHTDLEDLCGFHTTVVKLNSKPSRVAHANTNEFVSFVMPTADEEEDNEQAASN